METIARPEAAHAARLQGCHPARGLDGANSSNAASRAGSTTARDSLARLRSTSAVAQLWRCANGSVRDVALTVMGCAAISCICQLGRCDDWRERQLRASSMNRHGESFRPRSARCGSRDHALRTPPPRRSGHLRHLPPRHQLLHRSRRCAGSKGSRRCPSRAAQRTWLAAVVMPELDGVAKTALDNAMLL